jgi:hypothetical protein
MNIMNYSQLKGGEGGEMDLGKWVCEVALAEEHGQ